MKNIISAAILLAIVFTAFGDTAERIKKYSGKNAKSLLELYSAKGTSDYIKFILDHSSPNDLAVLTPEYIKKNVDIALKAKEFKYSDVYGDDIFRHFVLPLRISQEPFEDWRERFYKEISPIVKDVEDIEEAAILVNIWAEEQMTYKPTHGKDQAPLTTIRRGYGRCEEMMIIYMAAARSVGIPVRSAGTPLWNFTDSNHAWVEVWTPSGWKYLGEPADRLNSTWFTRTTERASMINSTAFGYYDGDDIIERTANSTQMSSIKYYTDQWDKCIISIDDENSMPVEEADVVFYAVSWGGISPMAEMKSDKAGQVLLPLGRGSVFITAYKEGVGLGYSMFDTVEGEKDIRIALGKNTAVSDLDLNFRFLIPSSEKREKAEDKKYFEGKFELMKDNAALKRKDRLNSSKKTVEFASYFIKSYGCKEDEKQFGKQKKFLEKCEILGGNADTFLKVYKSIDKEDKKARKQKYAILSEMITQWDDKELCEMPDSASVKNAVDIYFEGRQKYLKTVPDTTFYKNVIAPTWTGGQVVQNGWQKEFYAEIKQLRSENMKTTVSDVLRWADSKVTVDSAFVYEYYSGSMNPLNIINMKSVPEFYRTKLIDSALKTLGIPTSWKGSLEYFNGKEFVSVEAGKEKKEEKIAEKELRLKIYADGAQVKAEPWGNFQFSSLEGGMINYSYFDGSSDSLDFLIKYPADEKKDLYVQAGIRNTNGDASVAVRKISQTEDSLVIRLKTPKEYLDATSDFSESEINIINSFSASLKKDGFKVILVRGVIPNEPTNRMTSLLIEKASEFKKANASLIIYTEIRDDDDIKEYDAVTKKKGDILIPETEDNEYPLIFVMNEKNSVIFSSKGYNMNIGDLILKKIKSK
ncbi:MAG: transglutaminase-like domain-containing protein [Candidatus Delongbacteria bacterium]|nr:transglutaminase-like domain-containing protein [Candidatus Delongbacteria bacterium]